MALRTGMLAVAGSLCAHESRAQCPDGTPPPCHPEIAAPRVPPANSVAVLYFTSTSSDSADSYIADGLTDEIIVRLARVRRLDVKSRNEVRRFADTPPGDLRTLPRQLDVAYLVSGSVQPTRNGLRVRVELTRSAGMRAVWGASFQRADAELAAVTAAIADSVAQGVIGQLLPEESRSVRRGGTRSAVAYDLYLRGLAAARRYTYDSFLRAEGLFAEAVRVDSAFSDAWAARSDLWGWIADAYAAPPSAYPRSRIYAARAIRLDPANALAWASESAVRLFYDWNPGSALDAAREAVRIDPRQSVGQLSLGTALALVGDTSGAIDAIERAFELDSLDERLAFSIPQFITTLTGRNAEALQIARRIAAGPLRDSLAEPRALYATGDCEAAFALASARLPTEPARVAFYFKCPDPGPTAVAAADSNLARAMVTRPYLRPFNIAESYLFAGDVDKALPWLERAVATRDWPVRFGWRDIENSPRMAPILADSRIVALRRRAEAAPPPPLLP